MGFNPALLKYSNDGIPILSAARIEQIAGELLAKYCPEVLKSPQRTPLEKIFEKLGENTGLIVEFCDLGKKDGMKVLGAVKFRAKRLVLDESLKAEMKTAFPFTAAHEIGHWVLHRWNHQNWQFLEQASEGEVDDNEESLCRLKQRTPRDWLEFQANVFASSLLLPRATFQTAVATAQVAMGIIRNIGRVFHSAGSTSTRDYGGLLTRLAYVYGVSRASIEVKLRTSNLVKGSTLPQAPSSFPQTAFD